ncbi:hypothetical protein GCM10011579_013890 [Streptomyces albiflavescens]|uniref:Secreted protein n=1 Tax=Streptomyces albiflavescens TaxID=1623582 RepID=A0A917XV33_9ACTN|nr:hypothetical protein [Streptomyces albiflavescens]GGN54615.1 hypothetical protein GCM10011579_013890 [Streptomyces albiflavescens]
MRALPARRIATSALCATLLIGIATPAALAADSDSTRGRSHAAAPVPGADALLAQVQSLADIGGVLTPVTELVAAALKADNGQLSADDAAKLGQAVKDAIAKVTAAAPVTPPVALPTTPPTTLPTTAPTVTKEPTTPTTSTLPATKNADHRDGKARGADGPRAEAPADLKGDALTALQKAVDTLLKAVTSGDPTGVVPAATAVVTGLVNFVVATVLGGGLPAANLPGLPSLPSTLPTSSLPTSGLVPTS